ncbi:hypothetical protein FV228_28245, partial [Methylobacterium sp. WL18]
MRDFVPARPLLTQGPPSPAEGGGRALVIFGVNLLTEREQPVTRRVNPLAIHKRAPVPRTSRCGSGRLGRSSRLLA